VRIHGVPPHRIWSIPESIKVGRDRFPNFLCRVPDSVIRSDVIVPEFSPFQVALPSLVSQSENGSVEPWSVPESVKVGRSRSPGFPSVAESVPRFDLAVPVLSYSVLLSQVSYRRGVEAHLPHYTFDVVKLWSTLPEPVTPCLPWLSRQGE
jgi:hypothetical protein